MYAIEIGRKFLYLYNERMGTAYTAREFFDEVYYPLFFDVEEDEKHLLSITNSPFTNSSIKGKEKRLESFKKALDIQEKFPKKFKGSNFPGAKAEELTKATSAQVSNLNYYFNSDQMIFSWIGISLAIGLKGGFSILTLNEELLWRIYKGWYQYREFLKRNSLATGRQIEAWNGFWLWKADENDIEGTLYIAASKIEKKKKEGKGGGASKEYYALASDIKPNWWDFCTTKTVIQLNNIWAYCFSLGTKYNNTLGFINFTLEPVKRLREVWQKLFSNAKSGEALQNMANCYQTNFSLLDTIEQGGISLKQIQPIFFEKFFKSKELFPKKTEDFKFQLLTIKAWLMALLNDQQIFDLSIEVAGFFQQYLEKVGSSTPKHNVESFFSARTREKILETISEISNDVLAHNRENTDKNKEFLRSFKKAIALDLPQQKLSYFILLTKIEFQLSNK